MTVPPPSPSAPGPAAPLPRPLAETAKDVARLAAASQQVVDESHRLTPELAGALRGAGFARHFVPRRWGGTAGSFTAALSATAALGETCASTAWCAALYAAHGRLAAYLPEEGRAEVWASGPDTLIAACVNPPSGTAVPVAGGWRLNGQWRYASGVDHADWVLLASGTEDGHDGGRRVFAVPRADCAVRDTWRNLGLRGTGSNSLTVSDVFVPARRVFAPADLGRPAGEARCHRIPFMLVAPLQFAAPALGAARGALREWTGWTARTRRPSGQWLHELPSAQEVLARTSGDIHLAGLLLDECARRADRSAPSPLAVAENLRDSATASALCRSALDRLLHASGSSAQADGHPLQRRWRDVTAAASHTTLSFDAASAVYAREVFAAAGTEGTR
ncbi:acyl-CoA dehydrogenase family protein [Streptomyces sp. NPDC088387]|uniref:acyl-CoA dehydrogenase family protein n=1 Tax=Streptomyces sp. NPDC088387 TaxID=3365859 RepID=UPI0037F2942E